MKLAIVTVDYNGHSDTQAFLASGRKLKFPKGLESQIIVVDNGSDEPLAEATIQTGENIGFAGGYNRGIRYAQAWGADFIAVVNNDVLFPDPNIFSKLVSILEKNPRIGIVSPKILFAPGFEFHKDRYAKNQLGKVIWYAGGHFDWDNVASVHRGINELDAGQYNEISQTSFVSGCCFLARKEVFEQAGLFEEKLFAYFEDADFGQRVNTFEKYYCGTTSLYHKVSQTAGIGSDLTDYLLTRNRLYFGDKYAKLQTKFALAREAIKFLLVGRKFQKQGVRDFVLGKYGRPDFLRTNPTPVYPIKLSVVVINYKTLELTRRCLETIYHQPGTEVILVDNASEDNAASLVQEFPKLKFIGNKVNKGFSGANNQGIDYSRGEYILLLNSDTEARKDALQNLVESADKLGGNAITAGRLFFPDGSDQDSVFNLPTPLNAFKEYFLGQKGSYFMFKPQGFEKVECAVMACFMIPRRVTNKIGKLDESTFMYFEDVEYCRRAKENNIPVYFVPEAEFVHHHGASSKKIGQDKSYELLKKGSYFYHGPVKYWLLYLVLWFGQRLGANSPESRWTK